MRCFSAPYLSRHPLRKQFHRDVRCVKDHEPSERRSNIRLADYFRCVDILRRGAQNIRDQGDAHVALRLDRKTRQTRATIVHTLKGRGANCSGGNVPCHVFFVL